MTTLTGNPRLRRIGLCLSLLCAPSAVRAAIHFTDVGLATNTVVVSNTHGSGFVDYNNDGWDDIFVVHNTSEGNWINLPHTLLKNPKNLGLFENVTTAAGVAGYLFPSAQGLAAADYDNDGDTDILIGMGSRENNALMYKNNGNGTFTDQKCGIDVNGHTFHGRCIAFLDYNNDGNLDIFSVRDTFPEGDDNTLFVLYRSDGNGWFYDRTREADLWNYVPTSKDLYGFAMADMDLDGDTDIYVPRLDAGSICLRNNGNGTFWEESAQYNLPRDSYYAGAIFFDYDNDLDWDLFIRRQAYPSRLYRNDGSNWYTEVGHAAGVDSIVTFRENTVFGGGLSVADFDNDGDEDLLILTRSGLRLLLFRNNGDGTFTEISTSAGLRQDYEFYWSSPIGDYNRDGYLDIYMAKGPVLEGISASLYMNDGGSNHWIQFKLVGVQSNRSAVGARVVLYYGGGKKQMRQVLGGSGFKTDSYWVHFGLGSSVNVDSVRIHWPSGIVQRWVGLMADQFMTITEENSTQYGVVAIEGEAKHVKTGRPVIQAPVKLTGSMSQTDYTDVAGLYGFYPINYGLTNLTVTPSKPAAEDLGTGVITAYDASLVLLMCAGLDTLSATRKKAADADSSLDVNALDATYIARYAVGKKNDAASKVGRWRFHPGQYTYAVMDRGYRNQNFACWVTGDVSENWGSTSGTEKSGAGIAAAPSRIGAVASEGVVEIPLTVEVNSGLLAADVWFRLEGSGLTFEGAETTELTQGYQTDWNGPSDGLWKIVLYGARPVNEAGIFLKLRFRTGGDGGTVVWERFAVNERESTLSPTVVTGVDSGRPVPSGFGLDWNYPNPFNPGTSVQYRLEKPGEADLTVYDVRGRRVTELVRGWRAAGAYRADWDGRDGSGREVAAGVYICRLESGGRVRTIKMIKAD
jgi:hypothetical protein